MRYHRKSTETFLVYIHKSIRHETKMRKRRWRAGQFYATKSFQFIVYHKIKQRMSIEEIIDVSWLLAKGAENIASEWWRGTKPQDEQNKMKKIVTKYAWMAFGASLIHQWKHTLYMHVIFILIWIHLHVCVCVLCIEFDLYSKTK